MRQIVVMTHSEHVAHTVQRALAFANAHVVCAASWHDLEQWVTATDLLILHMQDPPDLLPPQIMVGLESKRIQSTIAIVPSRQPLWAVQLLDAGVDRYVMEPFDALHLAAVARALLRRRVGRVSSLTHYRSLSFDHERQQLLVHGLPVTLTTREAQVLGVLLRRVGQIISKEEFVQSIDPDNLDLSSDTIEVYIHRLRRKISHDVLPIRNIKRCGYFLKPDVPILKESTDDNTHLA